MDKTDLFWMLNAVNDASDDEPDGAWMAIIQEFKRRLRLWTCDVCNDTLSEYAD